MDNKQKDRSLNEVYSIYKWVINEFCKLLPLTTNLDKQRKQWNDLFAFSFLMNLNENYGVLKGQLLNKTTIPSFKLVFSHIQIASLTISPSTMTSTNHSAMAASDGYGANKRSHGQPRQSSGGCNVQPRDYPKCKFWDKSKHTEGNCWKKHEKLD